MKVLIIILFFVSFQFEAMCQVEKTDTIENSSNQIHKEKPVKYTIITGGYGKDADRHSKKEKTSAKISYYEGGYGYNKQKNDSIEKQNLVIEKNRIEEERLRKEYDDIEKVTYYTNFDELKGRESEAERNKSEEKAQAELINSLPVYNKPYQIYKKVVDPETKEIIEIYDFSNEQYVWDKKSNKDDELLKEKILRELKYELRLQEIKKDKKKEGDN